jgi:hypothetical protein
VSSPTLVAVLTLFVAAVPALSTLGCSGAEDRAPEAPVGRTLDRIAEGYVRLVLALGVHDPDSVDAYYGPEGWRAEAARERAALATIAERARTLVDEAVAVPGAALDEGLAARRANLAAQLRAVAARADMVGGARPPFDEESRALYDAVAPRRGDAHFAAIAAELEPLLPGEGPLAERYEAFRAGFAIPAERLDAVFRAAIDACRARTLERIELPPEERFEIEYVTGKPWSGYNWYQGGYVSLIQVNTDLPITIDRAIDLACHEGYPGHHVYNALLERELLRERGWIEFSVYPLFSPQSLIAEGTANFGIEMAFPGDERIAFERETLFPLAGLDPSTAERYYAVQERADALAWAGNEAARRYLDGEIDRQAAVDHLVRYSLMPRRRAEQRVDFIERYRSYVINYNLGQDLVRGWIERNGGTPDAPDRRWELFRELLSSPHLPSGLAG